LDFKREHVDDYVAMLYNDEIHSYDQVISTLRKVINVDDKGAFDYATIVDKEGRSALRRGKKEDCLQIKAKVEVKFKSFIENDVLFYKIKCAFFLTSPRWQAHIFRRWRLKSCITR
jgi:hypothetical protein